MAWCGKCYTPLDKGCYVVTLPTDENQVVVEKEKDKNMYMEGRDGDHLLTPFQCDLCHFRNIMGRSPMNEKAEDVRILSSIRRVNLDAFWSREAGTVMKNLHEARRALRICSAFQLPSSVPFGSMGPYPLEDSFGMAEAILMLERSTEPGKNAETIQFGTMRKMRSMFSNIHHASAKGQAARVMAKDAKKMTVSTGKTNGEFFERFIRGAHKRMGDVVKPDRALSLPVLHRIMEILERDWEFANDEERELLAVEGSFYLIGFCGGLRGEEIPLTDITGIAKWWAEGEVENVDAHVTVALLGRFKGETGEKYHLLPLASVTSSGLQPRLWIGRAIAALAKRGVSRGPLFQTSKGQPIRAGAMEAKFIQRLEYVQEKRPDLISQQVDVAEEYGVSRSFRRGSTTEAGNRGVAASIIEMNNRWRKTERSGMSQSSLGMREHYTDVRLALPQLLRYSSAL